MGCKEVRLGASRALTALPEPAAGVLDRRSKLRTPGRSCKTVGYVPYGTYITSTHAPGNPASSVIDRIYFLIFVSG